MKMQTKSIEIHKIASGERKRQNDLVAVEEPLEMVLAFGPATARKRQSLSITMRTPTGHDTELAMGFLFSESIIHSAKDVLTARYMANADFDNSLQTNVLQIELAANVTFEMAQLERHFYTSSSCGVCGKASIELVQQQSCFTLDANFPIIKYEILTELVQKLRATQSVFEQTGGIHAAALFDHEGSLLAMREDVGRHNALDKLIGFALKENLIPLRENILLLSGRISFELVQKAAIAGIPIIAAIGAPSSLAIELAAENNITLIGFLRDERMNIYTFENRIL